MSNNGSPISGCADKSFSRRDGLRLGVATVAALLTGAATAQQPASPNKDAATSLFDLLPDWSRANIDAPMTSVDLANLKDTATRFLIRNESGELPVLEKEMQDFAARNFQPASAFNAAKASGLFLLMRVIFELPDITGANEAWNFGGWYASEDDRAVRDKRESDDFHPAWPIYLARISNKLYVRSNTNPTSLGSKPEYRAFDEYRFMRGKYRFRTAESIAKMEFIFIAGK